MGIHKKKLAVLVAAMGCGAAHAEVVVYGMAMPFLENAKTTGATNGAPTDRPNMVSAASYTGLNDASRSRITVGTSHLGFRGSEDLGGGLKAVFQMESGFQIDQNAGAGLGARDSKIGLRHEAWGEIFLGQWDTPYKYIALPTNPIRGGYDFDRNTVIGNPGLLVPGTTTQFTRAAAKPDAAFDRRQGNSIQYWSPNWAGFTFRLQYSANEGKGAVVTGGPVLNPEVMGGSIQWDRGQLSLRYAYDRHRDYFGMSQIGGSAAGTLTNTGSKDEGHKFVILWLIGNTRITGTYEQLKYHNDDSTAGAVKDYKRNAYYAVLEQRFFNGSQSIFGAYGRAEDGNCGRVGGLACSTHALGASFWNVGYIYRFSKRTEGFLYYYKVDNKESGTYAPSVLIGTTLAPGADSEGYGLGLQHFF